MPSFIDKLQEILTTVGRLADLEKQQSAATRDLRSELRKVIDDIAALDKRLAILETRFDGLKDQAMTEAKSAAYTAATVAIGGKLVDIGERIVRLEVRASSSAAIRNEP